MARSKGLNVSHAEDLLKKARLALDSGETRKAIKLTRESKKAALKAIVKHEQAINAIKEASEYIENARLNNVDVFDAEEILREGMEALENVNYDEAIILSKKSKAALKPKPVLGRDVVLRTAFNYKDGLFLYKIKIDNQTSYTLDGIELDIGVPEEYFEVPPRKIIDEIRPYKHYSETIRIKPKFNPKDASENDIIPGKDVDLFVVVSTDESGEVVQKLKIVNKRVKSLENLHITMPVPGRNFVADPASYDVPQILPFDSEVLMCRLLVSKRSKKKTRPKPKTDDFVDTHSHEVEAVETPSFQPQPQTSPVPKNAAQAAGSPTKSIYECPTCKGPFVVESKEPSTIVSCPWCGLELAVGDLINAQSGGPQSAAGKPSTPPPPPPSGGAVAKKDMQTMINELTDVLAGSLELLGNTSSPDRGITDVSTKINRYLSDRGYNVEKNKIKKVTDLKYETIPLPSMQFEDLIKFLSKAISSGVTDSIHKKIQDEIISLVKAMGGDIEYT